MVRTGERTGRNIIMFQALNLVFNSTKSAGKCFAPVYGWWRSLLEVVVLAFADVVDGTRWRPRQDVVSAIRAYRLRRLPYTTSASTLRRYKRTMAAV